MTQGAINRSLVLDQSRITGQIVSNLNMTKRFRYKPFIINGGVSYTQDLKTKTVSGQLPSLRLNYNGNLFQNSNNAKAMTLGFIIVQKLSLSLALYLIVRFLMAKF